MSDKKFNFAAVEGTVKNLKKIDLQNMSFQISRPDLKITCYCTGQLADTAFIYLTPGARVLVSGNLDSSSPNGRIRLRATQINYLQNTNSGASL